MSRRAQKPVPTGERPVGEGPDQHNGRPGALSGRALTFVIFALFVTTLLAALDQTIFATALPTIVGSLGGLEQMLWVTTAYILAATIMMPVYGKLGDLFGHKPLLLSALALFLFGSVLGGLAHNMPMLISARAVQGLGGGGFLILSLAVVADVVPPRRRGTYMGILGGAWSFASVLGPILGGWFADTVGWRWAFWFNLPLGVVAVGMVSVFLTTTQQRRRNPVLDVRGMIIMAVATTALILVVSWGGREYAWDAAIILVLMGVAVLMGVLLIRVERKAVEPIIPLRLFNDRNFNLVTAGGLLSSVAFMGVIVYMPSYLQMVTGLSPTKSGLLLVPLSLGILISSLGSGVLTSRTGRYRWMPAASGFTMAVGLYLLSTLSPDTSVWAACVYLFLFGVGTGIGFQVLIVIVQNSFPVTMVGTASGVHNFFRQIGASLGSAVVGTLFTLGLMGLLGERTAPLRGDGAGAFDPHSLTPAAVAQMPEALRNMVISSYNDALTPIFRYLVPVAVLSSVLFLFIKEKPLGATNEVQYRNQSQLEVDR